MSPLNVCIIILFAFILGTILVHVINNKPTLTKEDKLDWLENQKQ